MPTDKLPHTFTWGASTQQEIEAMDRVEDEPDSIEALPDDMGRRGQILWIRGLTRLQHQVSGALYVMSSVCHSQLTVCQCYNISCHAGFG